MKACALLLAAFLLLAGCGASLLYTKPLPPGVPVLLGAIPCEAEIEWWDEDGDILPDFMVHRPSAKCLKTMREAAPKPGTSGRTF